MNFMRIDAFKNTAFKNIVVMPTLALSGGSHAKISILSRTLPTYSGGPIYPNNAPRYVKQCIGKIISIVVDAKVIAEIPEPDTTIESGVWCGHVHEHFGVMISDFAMRIAVSAAQHPDKFLLFAIARNADIQSIPEFFWGILDNLGAKKEKVRFINQPTLIKELIVYPQAERRNGYQPSPSYLKLLNSLHPPINKCYRAIYFSRGNYFSGGIAGERYLEEVMREMGVLVIRPEEYPLEKQLEFCKRAETLIFAEGSAVHLLQLVGTGIGKVIILNRRTSKVHFNFFCKSSVAPRASSLNYINTISETVYCYPEIQTSRGITILNVHQRFFRKFKKLGFNIQRVWNNQKYMAGRNQDVIKWFETVPISLWGDSRFHKKIKNLNKLSLEIRNAVVSKQLIYAEWQHLKKVGIFDESYYLTCNPDVKEAGVNVLDHYIKYGWKENRNPSVYFDSKFYLSQFPNGYYENLDPLSHYLYHGWKDNLNPNPDFNVVAYLNRYPEVKLANQEPLQHYVEYGRFLGYVTL